MSEKNGADEYRNTLNCQGQSVKKTAETKSLVDENVSDDDGGDSNSSTVIAGDADDELTPSPESTRRNRAKTKDNVSEDNECKVIADIIKGMMTGKATVAPHIDPLPPVEVINDSNVPYKAEGKDDKMGISLQKNRLISSMFAEIKGNSPSNVDGTGPSRRRENSAFGPSAKASMAASATMVTGLKKWQIRSQSSDVTSTFSKHPTHMADIRRTWKSERTRLPFPLMLQIQQEAEPILQNIVRAYKSTLGPKHKLTLQAIDKLEKLKIQIHGDGVYT